ncbi:type IV secretion system protein TraC [Thermodesulfovibrio sp. TK110]
MLLKLINRRQDISNNKANIQYKSLNHLFRAIFESTGISDFFTYLWAEDDKEYTLFETIEGIGFVYRVFIPPFVGDVHENRFMQIFKFSYPIDTVIQFFCYASENIKPYIDAYRAFHSYTPNVDNPGIIKEIIEKRASLFEQAAKKGFWEGIKFKPRVFHNFISFLIPFSAFGNNIEQTYRIAKSIAANVKGMLKGLDLHPVKVSATELRTILREIFNCDTQGIYEYDSQREFRRQIVSLNTEIKIIEDLHFNTDLQIRQNGQEKYIRVFTITKYPRKLSLWDFNNILFRWDSREIEPPLSCPFGFCLSVKMTDWKKTKLKIMAKTAENIRQSEGNALARFFPKIAKKAEEARYVAHLIEENAIPLPSYLTLFIADQTKQDVDYVSQVAINKLAQEGFELEREKDKNMVAALLESLPLNHIKERDKFLNRRTTLFDANLATMIPLISDVNGSSYPDELYIGRKGGIVFFHRYDSATNFNVSIVAESGGGKSFNTSNRHVHALASGRRVRVIDIGRSYEFLCQEIGGEYIYLTEERNPCFNFFTNIIEDANGNIDSDELDSIVPLVGFLCGLDISCQIAKTGEDNVSARYASIIIKAVNMAYQKKGKQAGLRDVADAFLEIAQDYKVDDQAPEKLYESIYPYSHGPYSKYFNGENNIYYTKDYVVLELEEIAQKDMRLKAAILFSLIIHIMREVYIEWSKHERRTDVDIDEAWMLFTLATASEFMESAARRFRKYGSSLCVITQGIDDAYKNPTTKAIWENSAHKIYLKMKHASIEQAIKENKLSMAEFEKEWFKTLVTDPGRFSEIYFETAPLYGVVRLVVDKFSYGFFTTTATEKLSVKMLAKQKNMTVQEVIRMLTERESIEKILMRYFNVSAFAIEVARQMAFRLGISVEDVLVRLGCISKDDIEKAKKMQEEQPTWETILK